MKLIYQHMLSFLLIILTTVAIIGYSEIAYVTNQSYSQNYQRMEDYASSLGSLAATDKKNGTLMLNANFLKQMEFVLRGDDLHLRIFDSDGRQIYPKTAKDLHLASDIYGILKQGQEIRIKNNNDSHSYMGHTNDPCTGVLVPWMSEHKMIGAIWLGARVKNVERPIAMAKQNLVNAFIVALTVGAALSLALSYYTTSKIKRLSIATKKVTSGNFDVQLNYKGNDEIDQLADNFNQMVRSLKQSDEEIKNQEKRRDQFMADAAHEMRTPLTTINGILEGLQYDAIPEDAKPKSISLMKKETKRLIRLVNENLDFEKIRNNQILLIKTSFNATKILEDVKMQLSQNAEKEHDEIRIAAPGDLSVYADKDRFTQIIFNLVQNAIQFTKNGQIVISGRRKDHATEIVVMDNGIGMSDEQMKYIFDRFFKADPSRARQGTGESGLGLSIVSSLIKQHGGKISVDSSPNEGAIFTITFFDEGFEQYLSE
ncbi:MULTISPECIES: HAMP domain-containing sensor histidine kinase [Lactobacillus]|uniref:sensor histidine kinase n=1 Tax=Lactobacillus TaxID=1578 RepID=UPI0018DC6DC7|nr:MULTISPECIES: HAMP domain-containing sensor histidine kinase [Lactobacillus]MBI0022133.1 HAMP domain-containing histidine kinase [Lactobacillus sp. W8172]MCT6821565.1 HAMP domain-containing histidine kinase [Lactobacillus apis]